jgi:Spy/CpxP family protein refolding chaperone
MTKITRTLLVAGALTALLCAMDPRADAGPPFPRPGHGNAPMLGRPGMAAFGLEPDPGMTFVMVLRGLGLTADQQARVQEIMESHRARLCAS